MSFEAETLNPVIEDTGESVIDSSSFLDRQLIVRLPGEVVETNGFYDLASQGVAKSINGETCSLPHSGGQKEGHYAMKGFQWLRD